MRPFLFIFDFMSKPYSLLLFLQSLLFSALVFMLCWFSRLATDDYYFIWDVREHGIIQSVYSQYMEWCGRYAATWLMDMVYLMNTDQTWYFLYPLITIVLLILGLMKLLSGLSSKMNVLNDKPRNFLLSMSFTALLFFSSAGIGETWFWYCSISSYLLSIVAFVWGIAFLLFETKLSFASALLCFIYVGGSSEIYSVVCGFFFLIWFQGSYKRAGNRRNFLANSFNKRILTAFLVFGAAFLLMLVAPGNFLRDELFPEHNIINSFVITAKSIVKFCVVFLPFKLVYVLAFAPLFAVAGKMFASALPVMSFGKFFKKMTLLFIVVLFLFFFMVAYLMVETGPPRIWFMVSFLCSLYITALAFYAGYCNYIGEKQLNVLKKAGLALSFLVLLYNLSAQYPIVKNYAFKHDKRVKDLLDLNKAGLDRSTQVNLPPLPPAGMLYSAEIDADTSHFTNKELRMGYDLNYQPVCDK